MNIAGFTLALNAPESFKLVWDCDKLIFVTESTFLPQSSLSPIFWAATACKKFDSWFEVQYGTMCQIDKQFFYRIFLDVCGRRV
jgi:hypothetical protein